MSSATIAALSRRGSQDCLAATMRTAAMPAVTGGEELTPRERELVGFVAAGASNKDIARRLSISVSTVKTHLTSIFGKLGLSTRLELAVAIGRATALRTKVG